MGLRLSPGCGPVVAVRAHAAEPHMSQPRAPIGALVRPSDYQNPEESQP